MGSSRFSSSITVVALGEKDGRSIFERSATAGKPRPRTRVLAHGVKAFEESVFGPCTLGRTGGTRPGKGFVLCSTAVEWICCSSAEGKSHRCGDTLDILAALGVLFLGMKMLQHQR